MSDDHLVPLTRLVLAAGVVLTLGTGLGLWLVPGETESYWAWVIRAPLSAAFLGAGYSGAAVSLGLALRARRWTRARASVVSALVLTTLALVATVRHGDTFLLGRGDPLPRTVAWIWLVVYLALPVFAVLAFVQQERQTSDVPRSQPLERKQTVALVVAGGAIGVPGVLGGAQDQWRPEGPSSPYCSSWLPFVCATGSPAAAAPRSTPARSRASCSCWPGWLAGTTTEGGTSPIVTPRERHAGDPRLRPRPRRCDRAPAGARKP